MKLLRINIFLFGLACWLSCVDKVDLSLPAAELPIIVDGIVTDRPGPDTVDLTQSYPADGSYYPRRGVLGAKMAIADDTGFVDSLIEIGRGQYITNALVGVVGRWYELRILLPDGTLAISTPQRMVSAGTIDSIYYEYTTGTNIDTGLPQNGFNVYINSTLSPSSTRRIQWKFLGTYTTTTDPAAIQIELPCENPPCPTAPLPCSENCLCCTCWYNTFESAPIVSNPSVLAGTELKRTFIQFIPINNNTFFERYRVEVSQLELSEEVFDFYNSIRKQAENSSSIFQPPFFELRGNVNVTTGATPVLGTFAASAVAKRHIYIPRTAVPYQLSVTLQPGDCRAMARHATVNMPSYWE